MVSFILNGSEVSVTGDHPHLLAALREELGVCSPKDGCSPSGQCGCCTVLVDSISGTCDFTSTLDFIFQTASANTFNFIFPNVGQGVYTLKVYAGVGSDASIIAGSGTAVGAAAFGLGSVTAETVRLVHGFEF